MRNRNILDKYLFFLALSSITILFLAGFAYAEPVALGYRIDYLEKSETRIVFTVDINGQYNWSDTDSAFGIFFGIPRGADFYVRLISVDGFPSPSYQFYRVKEAGIIRNLRIGVISLSPFEKTPWGVLAHFRFVFELGFSRPYSEEDKPDSPAFERIYRAYLVNPPPSGKYSRAGRYLIISGTPFLSAANVLAEWKRSCGYEVKVVTTSQTGTIPAQIKSYIQAQYNNTETRPDFLLLYGDVSFPGGTLPDYSYSGYYTSDHPYSLVDGADFLPDIFVGRLSVDTQPEAIVTATKVINYEKSPYMADTTWFLRAVGVSTYNYATSSVYSVKWALEELRRHSFVEIDTFFESETPIATSSIASAINRGVHYVDYRGWAGSDGWWNPRFSVSDVYSLRNVNMTPIVTSIVCGTGDYGDDWTDPSFAEAWIRVGTTTSPRGGVAFYGTTDHNTHTRYNNPINEGFYFGVFERGLESIGEAMVASKMELYARMIWETDDAVRQYFHTYNLVADPGLILRTGVPRSFEVLAPERLEKSGTFVSVRVFERGGYAPVENARISLYSQRDTLLAFAFSDSSGSALIFLPELRADTVLISVSKRDFIPYSARIPISNPGVRLSVSGIYVDDGTGEGTTGNRNGCLEPGERIIVNLRINSTSSITNPIILLGCGDPHIRIDSYAFMLPELVAGENGIRIPLTVEPGIATGEISIYLRAYANPALDSQLSFNLRASGSCLTVSNISILDTVGSGDRDGILEPGDDALLWVEISNNSALSFDTLTVSYYLQCGFILTEYSPLRFVSLPVSGRRVSEVPLRIRVLPFPISNDSIPILFYYTLGTKEYPIGNYKIAVRNSSSYSPVGPDEYGYMALTDMDVGAFPGAPHYSWVEIDTSLGGRGRLILSSDDTVEVIPAPFPFKFYGRTYTRLSLSSNGWVAPDSVPPFLFQFYNLPIPHPGGPWGIIAPWWDDLSPHIGGVYFYYDTDANRLILEWSNVPHAQTGDLQKFELIILDPAFYPTTTGDAELIFQYANVADTDIEENYSTVGIASPDLTTGIQYLYSRTYASGCPSITARRAIKFTTNIALGNLEGRVNLSDGARPCDAEIIIPGRAKKRTDENGYFIFRMLPPETLTVRATKPGYLPDEITLPITPYTTTSGITLSLEKIVSPVNLRVSKGDTIMRVNFDIPAGASVDLVRLYRSNIFGSAKTLIAELPPEVRSYVDTTIIERVKYYYYVSTVVGAYESEIAGPDSGWVGSTNISKTEREPDAFYIYSFPNPFNSKLTVNLGGYGTAKITITNILGERVFVRKVNLPCSVRLDFSDNPSGLYFIIAQTNKGETKSERVLLIR